MKKYLLKIRSRIRSMAPHHRAALFRVVRRCAHTVWYGLAVVVALLAVAFAAARLLLPMVAEKKTELEALLSRQSGYTVRIEKLSAFWDGLYPGVQMQGIGVYAPGASRPAVQLTDLSLSLKILPLFVGRAEVHSAVLVRPRLTLQRMLDGRYRVLGFAPVEETNETQNEAFIAWLFRQGAISIEDGELQWFDAREPGVLPRLRHVNLQLENNGNRHRLGFSAEFPQGVCTDCSFVANLAGNPLLGESFAGTVYLRARDVDTQSMPRVFREYLPEQLRGKFSLELWSDWKGSKPVGVEGDVSVSGLRLPIAGLRAPLSVKQAATQLRWRGNEENFDVTLSHLTLALHGAPWSAGKWEFSRQGETSKLRAGRIDLGDVTAFVESLRPAVANGGKEEGLEYKEAAALWVALKPEGSVENIRVELSGALDSPSDYSIVADLENLSVDAYQGWPGVRGATARLSIAREQGDVELALRDGAIALPKIFRAPIPVARASSTLRWRREADHWAVTTDDIAFINEDARVTGRLSVQLPDDSAQSPYVAINMDIHNADGKNAARYYPASHLSPATLAWMESSFLGGTVTDGTVVYDGRVADFPFDDDSGKFEIRAKVRDAVYGYLPGWMPVTGLAADVLVQGDRFLITGRGNIGALKADEVMVSSEDHAVRVRANVSGPVSENLRVLRDVKAEPNEAEWKAWLPATLEGSGKGLLSLDLEIPFGAESTRWRGEYRFLNATLRYGDMALAASNLTGSLRFDENGVHEGLVRGRMLGDETVLAVTTTRTDEVVAHAQGRITSAGLVPLLGPKLVARVSGAVPWDASLRIKKARRYISLDADLSNVKLTLPAPLNRPNGVGADKLTVRTEVSADNALTLRIAAGGLIQGRVRYANQDGWRLQNGRIFFNDIPALVPAEMLNSSERGIHAFLRLTDFSVDDWMDLVGDAPAGDSSSWLARVGADIRNLTFLSRDFGRMSVDFTPERDGWGGAVSGSNVAGRLRWANKPSARVELDLARLYVPRSKQQSGETDPRKLPTLMLKAKSFRLQQKDFGEIDFSAYPVQQGWRIERLTLVRPEARFEASGFWRKEHASMSSQFAMRFSGSDFGKTLDALGYPNQFDRGETEINAKLSWSGAPAQVAVASLTGKIDVEAKNGRFLQLSQGAGRLFGVLDLSAIGRYLTLDFTPIFGKGFAYDRIDAKIAMERGSAYTDELTIRGPSAKIVASGSIGLVAEDFHLVVDVYPSFSSGLTLGGFLAGGPQVALWTLIVQRLFKKQIEDSTRVTYLVNGPWKNPNMTRKVIEVSTPTPPVDPNQ